LEKSEAYNVYKCKNGLVDVAMPITICGEHVAKIFTGQFFFEAPDKEYFIRQAKEFGFDKAAYLEAFDRVPIFSENQIKTMTDFLSRLSRLVGELGFERECQREVNKTLRQQDKIKVTNLALMKAIPDRMFIVKRDGTMFDYKANIEQPLLSSEKFLGKNVCELYSQEVATQIMENIEIALATGAVQSFEYQLPIYDETQYYEARIIVSGEEEVLAICRNITDRKHVEEQLKHQNLHDALTGLYNRAFFEE